MYGNCARPKEMVKTEASLHPSGRKRLKKKKEDITLENYTRWKFDNTKTDSLEH